MRRGEYLEARGEEERGTWKKLLNDGLRKL